MPKTRVVIYLETEQREELELRRSGESLSEIGRRAIQQFLNYRNGFENRNYNPDNPPGRKTHWRKPK